MSASDIRLKLSCLKPTLHLPPGTINHFDIKMLALKALTLKKFSDASICIKCIYHFTIGTSHSNVVRITGVYRWPLTVKQSFKTMQVIFLTPQSESYSVSSISLSWDNPEWWIMKNRTVFWHFRQKHISNVMEKCWKILVEFRSVIWLFPLEWSWDHD